MKADLHIHTTASDGIYTPQEIVKKAYQAGLSAIAITDHDTFEGIQAAKEVEQKIDIEVIPGIELSTNDQGKEIHILGYFPDLHDQPLIRLLDKIKADKILRIKKMVVKLQEMGISLQFSEVMKAAGGENPGRPHIARVLIQKGYIKSISEAFKIYIGNQCPAFVSRYDLSTQLAIEYLIQARGIPVLAHPQMKVSSSQIDEFIKYGLKGIEVFHPKHTLQMQEYYLDIAHEKKLIVTGGSDFHGDLEQPFNITAIPYKYVQQMKEIRKTSKGCFSVSSKR